MALKHLFPYVWKFAAALVASSVLTLIVRRVSRRFGLVAKPRADRWHRKPTALFGGVAIFGAFLGVWLFHHPAATSRNYLLIACSTGMFLLGLVDDVVHLKPYAKLITQIVLATVLTTSGIRMQWLANPILDQGLTIFWLVGITNSLNLLDNIDGAAGGIAAIAGLYLVYFCDDAGRLGSASLAAIFSGAVIGFLFFNFNPASIFMGDCGSLFLGFFLGGVAVSTAEVGARRNLMGTLAIPVLLLLLPILDTTLVTVLRRYHGLSVSQGGRDHASHRLVALGLSERQATLTLWLIAALSGAVAVAVRNTSVAVAIALVGLFLFCIAFVMIFIGRVNVYQKVPSELQGAGRTLLPTLADFTYKRRIFETLGDLVLILLCYDSAFLLRFDGVLDGKLFSPFSLSLPIVVVVQLSLFLAFGLYQGIWHYTGTKDVMRIARAVPTAVAASWIAVAVVLRSGLPTSIFVVDGVLLLTAIAGSRIAFRLFRDWVVRRSPGELDRRRILIYGAGDAGELLLRELHNNQTLRMVPVGFVDDDPKKIGRVIHGVPVMGSAQDVDAILSKNEIDEVVISTNRIEEARWAGVQRACGERGLECRRLKIAIE